MQTIAGLARVGALTRLVSEAVLTGSTAGAGVCIVVSQLPAWAPPRREILLSTKKAIAFAHALSEGAGGGVNGTPT